MLEILEGKNAKEKADLKAEEIEKACMIGIFEDSNFGFTIEIRSCTKILCGVEVIARAWKDGRQLGFGKDGTVEWERFRIINPPILVSNPQGEIVREKIDDVTRDVLQTRYEENPDLALKQVLAETIRLSGKESLNIILGKVGNTTTTVYPDANPETTTVDGLVVRATTNESFTTIRTGVGTGGDDASLLATFGRLLASATVDTYNDLRRSFFLFDTSSIPDTDTISSATFSFTVNVGNLSDGLSLSVSLVGSTLASNTAIVASDFEGTFANVTKFATDKTLASLTVDGSTYNDWALNSSGIAAISLTGVTKFGGKITNDVDNVAPTWISSADSYVNVNSADTAGTTTDPKLVIVHSAAASPSSPRSPSGGASYGGFAIY